MTFPSAAHAAEVLSKFNAAPPTMMPRSGRTFKLNWETGLPGLQPRWDGEYSVFVGDLGREVSEADLVVSGQPSVPNRSCSELTFPIVCSLSLHPSFLQRNRPRSCAIRRLGCLEATVSFDSRMRTTCIVLSLLVRTLAAACHFTEELCASAKPAGPTTASAQATRTDRGLVDWTT